MARTKRGTITTSQWRDWLADFAKFKDAYRSFLWHNHVGLGMPPQSAILREWVGADMLVEFILNAENDEY